MSDRPVTHGSGSSAPGLTFVRPMPRGAASSVPGSGSEDAVATRVRAFSVPDRLFPSRDVEAAHGPLPVKGILLGHFSIEERIGRGGMGSVFRALDVRLERVVALKVLAPDFTGDFEAVQRFRNEARAAAQLDHNNIARVHFIGEEHGLHFIAFEFVPGQTVRQRIDEEGRLPQTLALNCALQIASALRHTNAMNVVHRDIKPSNLLLLDDGRVKLVDLGLARDFNRQAQSELTVPGTALGTFDYISPEQALDARNVDVRSDLYSLGCTLYHMVTGSPPYPQGTVMEKVVKHHQQAAPSPLRVNPELQPRFAEIIRKMMAAQPEARYADPEELLADLLPVAEELELQPAAPETLVWNPPDRTRWARLAAGARTWLVVLLILAGIVLADRWRSSGLATAVQTPATAPDGGPASLQPAPVVMPLQGDPAAHLVPPRQQPGNGRLGSARVGNPLSPPDALPDSLGGARPEAVAGVENLPPRTVVETGQGPFVVIAPNSSTRLRRPTLAAACAAAPNNAVIELQPGSDIEIREPLRILGKNLRLRGSENSRPRLRFDFSGLLALGASPRQVNLMEVERGSLELFDLDVEVIVDPDQNADWSLVLLGPAGDFAATGASFTFVNPGHSVAQLVHLPLASQETVQRLGLDRRETPAARIQLAESLVRGECDLVLQASRRDIDLQLENLAVAISGTLLRIEAVDVADTFAPRDSDPSATLLLDHLTAFTGQGLLRSDSRDRGRTPRIEVEISDSVFRQDHPLTPLISLRGNEEFDALHSRLRLRETRDPSFYQLSGPVCVVQSSGGRARESLELGLDDLGADSSHLVAVNLLRLEIPAPAIPLHRLPRTALMLRESPSNPALEASGDLLYAGVNWKLPRIPDPAPPVLEPAAD